MVKPFKLLHGYTYSDEYTLPVPPFGISRRHWNMLPRDLRGGDPRHMEIYIEGWEAFRNNISENPYMGINDTELIEWRELWNRGYMISFNRRTREYTERDMEYYNTDEFVFFDVTPVMYDPESYVPYKFMLFRHIEDGNTVQGSRITPEHPMYNFPDII